MVVKVGVYGKGLSAILGTGAIILAVMENPAWKIFLAMFIIIWVTGFYLGKYVRKNKGRSNRIRTKGRRR